MDDFSSSQNENFERIKERATSYGYNASYGHVIDNRNDNSKTVIQIVVAGTILVGGFFYLKSKVKKLLKNIFSEPEMKVVNEETTEKTVKRENKLVNPNNRNRIFDNYDKSNIIDVEYTIQDTSVYDKEHPDNIQDRNYSCQFTKA